MPDIQQSTKPLIDPIIEEANLNQTENEQNLYQSVRDDGDAENISFATQNSKNDKEQEVI